MTEEYRIYEKGIEVSNLGNVRKNGEEMEIKHGETYDYVFCDGKQYRIHIMVAECFPEICGARFKFSHIHHKNRNQRDNRAENLTVLSASDHKRIHQLEDGVSVAVKAYDLKGNYIGRWDSMEQAAYATGAERSHLSAIINGSKSKRYTAGDCFWFKEETPEEEAQAIMKPTIESIKYFEEKIRLQEEKREKKILEKKIIEFNEKGEEERVWDSIKECAENYGKTRNTIEANLTGKTAFCYVWDGKNKKKIYFKRFISYHS